MSKEGDKNFRPSFAFSEFILAWSVSSGVSGLLNWDGRLVQYWFTGLCDKQDQTGVGFGVFGMVFMGMG